jgi:hypothetical protein
VDPRSERKTTIEVVTRDGGIELPCAPVVDG